MKPGNAVRKPQAASTDTGAAPKARAAYVLKYIEKDDNDPEAAAKFVRITGLFESRSKKGEVFYKGTDKNSGITYLVMPNTLEG